MRSQSLSFARCAIEVTEPSCFTVPLKTVLCRVLIRVQGCRELWVCGLGNQQYGVTAVAAARLPGTTSESQLDPHPGSVAPSSFKSIETSGSSTSSHRTTAAGMWLAVDSLEATRQGTLMLAVAPGVHERKK